MRRKTGGIKANQRFAFILFVFMVILTVLFGRVLYWKVVHGAEFEAAAKNQQINRYDLVNAANRGSILDRNEQVLAVSTAVYNVVTTMTFMLFPLWIGPAIRGVKKLFQLIYIKGKIRKVESTLDQMAVSAQSVQPKINASALQPFLPIEVRDNRDEFANNLSELSVLTTSAIQRKCKCGNNCAYAVLQNLQVYGMIREIRQFTYEWTEKALLLGAEGRNG